jgi:hypothetical protein
VDRGCVALGGLVTLWAAARSLDGMWSERAKLSALIVSGLAAGLAGCGSTSPRPTSPRCGSGCARVHGRLERCGGPAPGRCRAAHARSVSLIDSRGRVATKEAAGRGGTLSRFSLAAEAPGRYTLRADIAGTPVIHSVQLRTGHSVLANLILQVR